MKVTKEIMLFHPAHGWMVLDAIKEGETYSTDTECGKSFDSDAKEVFTENNPTLAFNDYTKGELPQWATLDEIKKRLEPQHPVEGKLYKVWNDHWMYKCISYWVCSNSVEKLFTNSKINLGAKGGTPFDHFEPIEGIDYND